eukprot:scaffold88732_cov69-Phaeocystis_antarctica.AAC.1
MAWCMEWCSHGARRMVCARQCHAPKSDMSIGTPSTSMPWSSPRGSCSAPTHFFSVATPSAASSAQMPSMSRPSRCSAVAASDLTAAASGAASALSDQALAVSAPPRPSASGCDATARCALSYAESTSSALLMDMGALSHSERFSATALTSTPDEASTSALHVHGGVRQVLGRGLQRGWACSANAGATRHANMRRRMVILAGDYERERKGTQQHHLYRLFTFVIRAAQRPCCPLEVPPPNVVDSPCRNRGSHGP